MKGDGVDETNTVYVHCISYQCHIAVTLGGRYRDLHGCSPDVRGPSTWSFSVRYPRLSPPYVVCAFDIIAIHWEILHLGLVLYHFKNMYVTR